MVASASEIYGLVKMSYKVTPPDLRNSKSYELFKKELDIWEITTPVPEEKRGAVIAALLPNDCKLKKDLKDKFFETVDVNLMAASTSSLSSPYFVLVLVTSPQPNGNFFLCSIEWSVKSCNAKFGWVIPSRPETGISCFRKCILMYLQ